jgi:hypothetical protein
MSKILLFPDTNYQTKENKSVFKNKYEKTKTLYCNSTYFLG